MDRNAFECVDLGVAEPQHERCDVVLGADDAHADGVERALCGRLPYFEVEVRPERRAAVARAGHHVALRDGELAGLKPQVDAVAARAAPLGVDALLQVVAEAQDMAVDGRMSVAERDVEGASVAARRHREARDVAVAHGDELLAHRTVGLDVDAAVEVARAQLAEVGRIEPGDLPDGVEVSGRILACEGSRAARRKEHQGQKVSHSSFSLMSVATRSPTVS